MRIARELRITGTVQGVGFRWTAKRIADSLGVDGWVRNNPDGSVDLRVEGKPETVDSYLDRLREAMGWYIVEMESKDVNPDGGKVGFGIVY